MSVPLYLLTAEALAEAYRAGSLSPVEATEAALSRIEALDPVYNAWCHLDRPAALAAARAAEARWRNGTMLSPIDGVPTGIKDFRPTTVRSGDAGGQRRDFQRDFQPSK